MVSLSSLFSLMWAIAANVFRFVNPLLTVVNPPLSKRRPRAWKIHTGLKTRNSKGLKRRNILVIEGAVDKDVGMEFSSAVHLARFHFCMDPSRLWMTTSLPFEILLALLSAADLVL